MEVVNTIIAILIDRIDRNIRMDGNLAHSITNCINAKNPKKQPLLSWITKSLVTMSYHGSFFAVQGDHSQRAWVRTSC